MKTKPTQRKLALACLSLLAAGTAFAAQTTFTWTDALNNHTLNFTNNWSPLTAGRPAAGNNDILQFDGSVAGTLVLTNGPGNAPSFDANIGLTIQVAGTQTSPLTLVQSNGYFDANGGTGRMRLATNVINIDPGAGPVSIGNGSATPMTIALVLGAGNLNTCSNNSANTAMFGPETCFIMGGGNAHTLRMAGTGTWILASSIQCVNSSGGSLLNTTIVGPGTTILSNIPVAGITYGGPAPTITLAGGTLALGTMNALGSAVRLQINGGTLDSLVPSLVVPNNNPETWNGDFTFAGTQSMDTGLGPVTNTANRIVTVNANTLTVGGPLLGTTASLTKAGAGTLLLNSVNLYTGGTTVSNGVLKLGTGMSLPFGTAAAERLTVQGGTMDLNGNSITVSSLSGNGGTVDTSGGAVTLTVGDLDGSGAFAGSIANTAGPLSLTKTGIGTLTLGGASTYSGGTAVNSGALLVANTSGSATGAGAVTVSSAATFGGSGSVAGPVTWQPGALGAFTLSSVNGGPNTTPLAVNGTVALNGNNITVNVAGVIPLEAGTYTLMTYSPAGSSGAFSATGVTYTGAGVGPGNASSVSTSGGTVTLTITSLLDGIRGTWTNSIGGNWSVLPNWSSNPTNVPQSVGDLAKLGFGTSFTTVTLDANERIGGLSFTNANSFTVADAGKTLTFDNATKGAVISVVAGTSNSIATAVALNDNLAVTLYPSAALAITNAVSGSGKTLTMGGLGTLTLSANNTYGPSAGSVGTTLGAGATVQLGNNNALSTGDVVATNGTETVRALTGLTVANNFSIAGATMSFDNNGNNATLSGSITGTGAFAKNGAGTLTLSSPNTFTNGTTINAGTLALANTSAIPSGSGYGNVQLNTNATLDLNGTSPSLNGLNGGGTVDSLSGGAVTLTLGGADANATFTGNIKNSSGSLALVKAGAGTQTLGGTNTHTGGTTINAGTLRVGNGNTNATGSLSAVGLGSGSVLDNGTLEFNLTGTNFFSNVISGGGAVNLANTNLNLFLSPNNTFTGNININSGSLWVTNVGSLGTAPKTIYAVGGGVSLQTQLHLAGNVTIPSSISLQLSCLYGAVVNESGNNTIQGPLTLPYGGGNAYVICKSGFLTLSGDIDTVGANGRQLQLGGAGNGLYSGNITDISQFPGGITKSDAGTWTVTGGDNSGGATLTVNGGTLVFNGQWSGPAVVNTNGTLTGTGTTSNLTVNLGGKFVPGAFGSIGTFTVVTNFTLSGAMYTSVNKSLGQPNTLVVINSNSTANSGSTLIVSNLGPALVPGDRFQLFTQPLTNGNLVTITAPANVTFTNNLAVDGSISVIPALTRTNMSVHVSGGQVTLSWDAGHLGWLLESNSVSLADPNSWVTVPGSGNSTSFTFPVNPAVTNAFFRMSRP